MAATRLGLGAEHRYQRLCRNARRTHGNGSAVAVNDDVVVGAGAGSLHVNADGTLTFTPTPNVNGPVTFMPDGRIAIGLTNTADVPVSVKIDAPLGISGTVEMIVPHDELKLQLLSRPLRGVER